MNCPRSALWAEDPAAWVSFFTSVRYTLRMVTAMFTTIMAAMKQ